MDFAHFSHIWRKPGMSPADRYEQLWRELEVADAVGFDMCFAVEHHVDPQESLSCSPPLYIASAAARTQNMRLGAMGWTVPLYDPLRVVEEVVSLDHLTRGRRLVLPTRLARASWLLSRLAPALFERLMVRRLAPGST